MRSPTALLGFAAAAALGCSEPTAPASFTGTFVLADARLPVHLFTNEFGAWFATADTIRFNSDGQGVETGSHYMVPAGGASQNPVAVRATFSFRVVNGNAEVTFPCPPNANCAPPPHWIVMRTPGGVHVTYPNSIAPLQDFVELRGVP
jgi:hypothetical protein